MLLEAESTLDYQRLYYCGSVDLLIRQKWGAEAQGGGVIPFSARSNGWRWSRKQAKGNLELFPM